jgi:tetratricopeptide (TPR) repeat protein
MLGGSAYFAFKIYEHIQTLQDPQEKNDFETNSTDIVVDEARTADAFSIFDSSTLIEKADEARENEDLDKAIALYREANIKEPKNAEVLFKMGYTLSQAKRNDEALEYLLESIEVDDENPFAYKTISEDYAELGDDDKADEYYKIAKELDEDI